MDASVPGRFETTQGPPSAGAAAVASASGPTADQRVARGAVWGILIGLVAMSALGTGMGLVTGQAMTDSLAIGAFAGFWGGPGFGGMLGATLAYTRAEARQDERDAVARAAPAGKRAIPDRVPTTAQRGAA